MKKLLFISVLTLFIVGRAHAQLDNLPSNPSKQNNQFLGKAGNIERGDPYMWPYEIVFNFRTLFGEPIYEFRFKWDFRLDISSATVSIPNSGPVCISRYPDIFAKFKKRIAPCTSLNSRELLTVPLFIEFRQGNTVLALIEHHARIDLPDPAGKWNVFSLPSTDDWIEAFPPFNPNGGIGWSGYYSTYEGKYDSQLRSFYKAGNKDEYAKLMLKIWKESDNIKVRADLIYNIRWNIDDFKYLVRERFREEKEKEEMAKKAGTAKTDNQRLEDLLNSTGYSTAEKQTELDKLLGSTGYSKNEIPNRRLEQADALYQGISGYNERSQLNQARNYYSQATDNPEITAYANMQISKIDRVLAYKPIGLVDPKGTYQCTRGCGFKFSFKEDGIDTDKGYYSFIDLFLNGGITKTDRQIIISDKYVAHGVTFEITNNGIEVGEGYKRIR